MIPLQAICPLIAIEPRAGFGVIGSQMERYCVSAVFHVGRQVVDGATTACFSPLYLILDRVLKCVITYGSASLMTSRKTSYLIILVLAV